MTNVEVLFNQFQKTFANAAQTRKWKRPEKVLKSFENGRQKIDIVIMMIPEMSQRPSKKKSHK